MRILLKIIDPFWKEIDLKDPTSQYGSSWLGIRALAWLYFIQLGMKRLLSELSMKTASDADDMWWQIGGTILGGIIGAILLDKWRSTFAEKRNSLKKLLILSTILFVIGYVACLIFTEIYIINVGHLCIGLGWACGIGGAILWCCEYLPSYLRTSAALYIGSMGFLGAGLVSFGIYFFKKEPYLNYFNYIEYGLILMGIGGLIWTCANLPKDSKLSFVFQQKKQINNFNEIDKLRLWLQKFKQRSYLAAVLISLFLASSVQYTAFFFEHIEKHSLLYSNNENLPDIKNALFGLRYISFVFGALLVIRFSWYWKKIKFLYRQRISILATFQFIQFIVFLVYVLWYHVEWWLYVLTVVTGVCSVIWILSLLVISEHFSMKERVFWLLFAPNAYRAIVDTILNIRFFSDDYLSSFAFTFTSDKTFELYSWGLIFMFMGFIFSLFFKNRFERNPSYIDDESKISDASIRNIIYTAAEKYKDKSDRDYLDITNEKIGAHLINILQQQIYFSTIYLENDKNTNNPLKFINNPNTFEVYATANIIEEQNSNNTFNLITKLVQDHTNISIINQLKKEKKEGGVIWFSPKQRNYELEGYEKYETINLNKKVEQIDNNILKELSSSLNLENSEIIHKFEQAIKKCYPLIKPKSEDYYRLVLYLILRADVENYKYGEYYLHFILPYTPNSQVSLVLKTSEQFTAKRLEELRSLISFVENVVVQRRQFQKEIERQIQLNNELYIDSEHNRKTELYTINRLIEALDTYEVNPNPTPQYQEKRSQLLNITTHLYKTAELNSAIERYRRSSKEHPLDIDLEELNLSDLMKDIWQVIKKSSPSLRFSEREHKERVKEFLNTPDNLPQLSPFWVKNVAKDILQIILVQLIKNAFENTDEDRPIVKISFNRSTKEIIIMNTIPSYRIDEMKVGDFTFPPPPDTHPTATGIGLRTAKNYLSFFYESYQQAWEMKAEIEQQSDINEFKLSIIIPSECIQDNHK